MEEIRAGVRGAALKAAKLCGCCFFPALLGLPLEAGVELAQRESGRHGSRTAAGGCGMDLQLNQLQLHEAAVLSSCSLPLPRREGLLRQETRVRGR